MFWVFHVYNCVDEVVCFGEKKLLKLEYREDSNKAKDICKFIFGTTFFFLFPVILNVLFTFKVRVIQHNLPS